jgi:pimeloyl-ACP methyl ester carboxylesterase
VSDYRTHAEDAGLLLGTLGAAPGNGGRTERGRGDRLRPRGQACKLVAALVLCGAPLHAKRSLTPRLIAMVIRAQLLRRLKGELRFANRSRTGEDGFARFPSGLREAQLRNAAAILADLDAGTGEHLTNAELAAIRCPTVCVVSDGTPSDMTAFTTRIPAIIPHATVERIDGAGHAMFRDQPEWFAQIVHGAMRHSRTTAAAPPRSGHDG